MVQHGYRFVCCAPSSGRLVALLLSSSWSSVGYFLLKFTLLSVCLSVYVLGQFSPIVSRSSPWQSPCPLPSLLVLLLTYGQVLFFVSFLFFSFLFYASQMFVFLSFCHHTTMCVLLYLSVCLPRRRRRRRWHEKSEQNKRLWSSLWSVWLRWHTKTWSKVSWLPANFLAVIERDVTTYLSRSSEREREREGSDKKVFYLSSISNAVSLSLSCGSTYYIDVDVIAGLLQFE